ncbi:hypothetical protein ACWGJ2_19765 [Streptomyces sp. NPDC054796]
MDAALDVYGLTFGPQNAFTHEFAATVDIGKPRDALNLTDNLDEALAGLPSNRSAPTLINAARAWLASAARAGATPWAKVSRSAGCSRSRRYSISWSGQNPRHTEATGM